LRRKEERIVSEKSTKRVLYYAYESRGDGIAMFFGRNCGVGLPIPLKSGMIRANQD
jgi:hypothetical protein